MPSCAGIDRRGRHCDTVEQRGHLPVGCDQHRRGVEQDDIAPRSALAVEDRADGCGVGCRIAAANGIERRRLEPYVPRIDDEIADALERHLVTARGSGDAQLVDAVGSGEDKRVDVSESMQHLGHHGCQPRIRNPQQLMTNPSRVGQRAEHVEHGSNAELAANRGDVTQRRMERGCEEEADAGLFHATPNAICATRRSRPRAPSSTSALPHREDAARFPCLATGHPAPAATSAAAVEMLKVPAPSPPVPHVSTASTRSVTGVACARMDSTIPVSSSTDSPLVRSAAAQRLPTRTRRPPRPASWCPSPPAPSGRRAVATPPSRVPAAAPPHPSRATVAPSASSAVHILGGVTARTLAPIRPRGYPPPGGSAMDREALCSSTRLRQHAARVAPPRRGAGGRRVSVLRADASRPRHNTPGPGAHAVAGLGGLRRRSLR